jgi:hypothetical protein
MKTAYLNKRFHEFSLTLIHTMNAIMADYERQGFKLSVRQLYYQLVTRNEIENSEREYNRIIRLCNDAHMCGLMDWDLLEDRTREFVSRAHWRSGDEIILAAADTDHQDRWANQDIRVFGVVEKDALSGVQHQPVMHWIRRYSPPAAIRR